MSFREKSNALMLGAMVLIFGGYFGDLAMQAQAGPVELNIGMLGAASFALVLVAIAGHIAMAAFAPAEAGEGSDERDRSIETRGSAFGGRVLALFAVAALTLAVLGYPMVWVANAVLAGLVAGEIAKGVSVLIAYRQG